MIALFGTSVFVLVKYAIIDRLGILVELEQPFPWLTTGCLALTIAILIALPALMDGRDAIIPNGLIVASYVALMTSQSLLQISVIEKYDLKKEELGDIADPSTFDQVMGL